jgi:phenylalanyl-tRNA synthetase beta chain
MRQTLLANMLDIAAANMRWTPRQLLFEAGPVYLKREGHMLPDEPARLSIVLLGERDLPAWQDVPGMQIPLMDFYDLKGVIEELVEGLHLEGVRVDTATHHTCYPGRAARLSAGGRDLGVFGQLHPRVVAAFGLPDVPVLAAELDLDALTRLIPAGHRVDALATYPAVYQDIAVVVDEAVPATNVEQVIREAGGDLLGGLRLFDVFQGEQLGAGKKSLAYALTFQSLEKTLRDKDVDKLRSKIIRSLESRLGARLRS